MDGEEELCKSNDVGGKVGVALPAAPEPFLVLHFDVNKTIVMSDACQGYSVTRILGEVLGRATYGRLCETEGWVWNGLEPSVLPRDAGDVSYFDFLKRRGATGDDLHRQLEWLGREGGAVPGVRPARERLEAVLRLPAGEACDRYRGMFREGSFPSTQPWRYVVPAFFRLLQALAERRRRFSVVLRTFGVDLANGLCEEIDAFAQGQHPLYPGAGAYDGSGGRPDLRISMDDPSSHGSFYRGAEGAHLILGTTERPPPDGDISEVGMRHFEGSGLRIVSGHSSISAEIARITAGRGVTALRDYWPWWGKAQGESSDAGKLMHIDLADTAVHPLFFDDHVGREDAHIVDAIDMSGSPLPFVSVAGVHLIRSEPLECLSDPDYFVRCVDAAERQRLERLQAVG
mmetsp:Transcript_88895/g.251969  ORF Transcript_88895/g.251969 Transcript_88895/m.251969 type:complete len:401 (+) Transcript_88895:137-1339(+)